MKNKLTSKGKAVKKTANPLSHIPFETQRYHSMCDTTWIDKDIANIIGR